MCFSMISISKTVMYIIKNGSSKWRLGYYFH